jgi:hypothetical protein
MMEVNEDCDIIEQTVNRRTDGTFGRGNKIGRRFQFRRLKAYESGLGIAIALQIALLHGGSFGWQQARAKERFSTFDCHAAFGLTMNDPIETAPFCGKLSGVKS